VIASGTTPSDSNAWGLTGTSPGNVYWMGSQAVAAGTVGALTLNRLIGGEHPEDSQQHTLSGSGSPSYASSHTMQSSATSGASRPYLSRSFYLQGRNNGAHLSSEAAAVAKLAYGDLHQLDTNMGSAACHVDAYTILQFGQPERHADHATNDAYDGYGVSPFGDKTGFETDTQIAAALLMFESTYRSMSPRPCATMKLIVASSNDHICATRSAAPDNCSALAAGLEWTYMINDVIRTSDRNGYSGKAAGQVFVWGGGDLETGGPDGSPSYDNYDHTVALAFPFSDVSPRGANPSNAAFIDFGDFPNAADRTLPAGRSSCFANTSAGGAANGYSAYHLACLAFLLRNDYALPQIYKQGQVAGPATLNQRYHLGWQGPLSSPTGSGYLTPDVAYDQLLSGLRQNGYNGPLAYRSRIGAHTS